MKNYSEKKKEALEEIKAGSLIAWVREEKIKNELRISEMSAY